MDTDEPEQWHSSRCDYDPNDPTSECFCIDPRSNPVLECGHRLEDYCFCSEY